jgi:hypothetical protein
VVVLIKAVSLMGVGNQWPPERLFLNGREKRKKLASFSLKLGKVILNF